MEVRDVLRNIQWTWLVLVPLFGQAMALSNTDQTALLATLIPITIILLVVATIFIIRYYKKLKEVRKNKKRKDAKEMMMMRDNYAHRSPHSVISSATGTRIPDIMVNGQPKPGMQPKQGKSDWTWTPENGQVKRPTPALPGVVPQKPSTGVAKKVSKKKGAKQPENATPPLPYPPFKQQLYAKNTSPPLPFEEQVMSLDMVSELGDVDDRGYDNEVFEDDEKPASPTSDREAFMMQRITDELNLQDVNETSKRDSLNPHVKVEVEDFVGQVNEDDIYAEVYPTKTIPSEVYFSERLYNSVEKPKPEPSALALPEAEIILELVEMIDFSSLVYAKDIEDEYVRLEEEEKMKTPKLVKAESVGALFETQQSKVVQQVNIPPPPLAAKEGQPFLAPQMMQQPQPMYPIPAPVGLPMGGPPPQHFQEVQRERPKSTKSSKSWKSNKSSKSNKSNKSNKSKISKKMVPKRQAQKSDFAGQCQQDHIARETGFARNPDNDDYAVVQRPKQPVVPPKNFKESPQVTQAKMQNRQDEDEEELLIPDMGLFDLDEGAMRNHHVRLKKPADNSPYRERKDSGDSLSDDNRLSADAEVNAIFASIFQDHSRGDTSEDELEGPRTPRTHAPQRAPSPAPPVAAPITQEQLINEQLDKQECSKTPEPVPSTSKIGPNIEPDRLRHDEAHDVESVESNPKNGSGGRPMETDYENNWGKLTDDTLPRQDY